MEHSSSEDTQIVTIQPLKGQVCSQLISCRKPDCRCSTGALHGPYFYRIWRDGDKVHKKYVRRQDVDAVRAACAAHKVLSASLTLQRQTREEISRRINKNWQKTKHFLDTPIKRRVKH